MDVSRAQRGRAAMKSVLEPRRVPAMECGVTAAQWATDATSVVSQHTTASGSFLEEEVHLQMVHLMRYAKTFAIKTGIA